MKSRRTLRGLWILCAGFAVTGCGREGEAEIEAARWQLAPTAFVVGGFTDDERYSLSEVMGATGWGDFEDQFQAGYYVATAPVVLVRQGQLVHEFGERLSSERIGSVQPSGEPSGSGPHPFGRKTSVAIGGGRVYLGDAAEYSVEAYDFAGHPLPSITWSGPAREISDRHIALYEDAQVSQASESRRPAVRRRIRDIPRLERFPAYDRLRVDTAGNLWVRHFPKPGETEAEWVVFDGGGAMVGRLLVPMRTTLLELGADYAIVVETDELDVETVRVMRLVK